MNITIKTLTVQVESKEVPLTKAMVNQLPYLPTTLPKGLDKDAIKCIGSVSLTDAIWYLYSTPTDLYRSKSYFTCISGIDQEPQRFILTK